jgi:hypothetical protein
MKMKCKGFHVAQKHLLMRFADEVPSFKSSTSPFSSIPTAVALY